METGAPLGLALRAAKARLLEAAARLGRADFGADAIALRFRPDGRGGELASPLPMVLRCSPEDVIQKIEPHPWFERIFASGTWIALDLSEEWRDLVRQAWPKAEPLDVQMPPAPDFCARIDPELWRLDAALGITDPMTAARLDRGNPAFRIRWALDQAGKQAGQNRRDRALLNRCALALEHGAPGDCLALAEAYLAQKAEDETVHRALSFGINRLKCQEFTKNSPQNAFS